ncbi:hypothetical protein KR222_003775 [Zaprionus bogoriensis]|nr:hypothetical protein KR222_003775 [Zaprionus bogoriensis]
MANKQRGRSPSRSSACGPLTLLLLLLFFSVCLADALKAGMDVELPVVVPMLNVEQAESTGSSDFEQLVEAKLNDSSSGQLLSRQRRYLVFPEGSSFQMVFDEIICVVDYTNYLVVGITAALAWELPSKPPSEAFEDLLNKLNEGTIDVSRNDTVSNITYVDDTTKSKTITKDKSRFRPSYINLSNVMPNYNSYYSSFPIFRTPMHPSHHYADSFYRPSPWMRPSGSTPARRKDSYYYSNSVRNPLKQWTQSYSPAQNTRFPYWALSSHLRERNNLYGRSKSKFRQRNRQQKAPPNPSSKSRAPLPRRHQVYPIYGKRSLPDPTIAHHHRQRRSGVAVEHDDKLTRMEGIQIKYHRNSREKLYERIEKYLDKRGQKGHQCVLRTLCETGQKSQEREPGSFVGELLRAVFTMPEALDQEAVAYRDTRYDKAHAAEGDCAALYPDCQRSIWEAPFVQ